jgi:hypothetical protein
VIKPIFSTVAWELKLFLYFTDLRMECKNPKWKHFRAEYKGDSTHEDNAPRFTLEAMANLPLLPDDVLLCIMKYLGPVELHNLSK